MLTVNNASDEYKRQIEDFKLNADPVAYLFSNGVLSGFIENTSESWIALNNSDEELLEEYPQDGEIGNEGYYRLCESLESRGYDVIHCQ